MKQHFVETCLKFVIKQISFLKNFFDGPTQVYVQYDERNWPFLTSNTRQMFVYNWSAQMNRLYTMIYSGTIYVKKIQ